MATPIQDLTTTLTGLIGQAPTAQQLTNVGAAFFYRMTDDDAQAIFGHTKAAMTAGEKAAFALRNIRSYVKQYVIQAGVDATNDANAAAAAAAGNANAGGL